MCVRACVRASLPLHNAWPAQTLAGVLHSTHASGELFYKFKFNSSFTKSEGERKFESIG
jgi:hypothetical protein